ncbi:MAG TPA: class I SAM-dependent methyltransferase [Polyangiaceae bacterium]|nr:class I SAM-dependent methyltransferase [Polyangiaceae bacterium]
MSSENARQRYVTDIAYVRQFCSELNPALLRATAALAGCPPPPGDDFDFCELGSGFGDTVATLAAAYPNARFVGVDLNPEHVGAARSLASRGALENVRFLECDFEDLSSEELPKFDYLCAHGLISWIAPEKRAALFARAAAWLKPGGLLYLGYNALPGWAAVEPLRRFMLDASADVAGGSAARARHGLAAAKVLCEAGADYFVTNPSAQQILATMLERGAPYVAHEFFNAHWYPLYFADVVEEAAERDLRFVGQLPLHLNYRDLALPPALGEASRVVSERRAWEQLRAFATNEFFRRDVYVNGAVAHSANTTEEYLETTAFGTLVPLTEVKREVALPNRTLAFTGPLFDGVVEALASRSSTVLALAMTPSLAAFGLDAIRQAVLALLMGTDVIPVRSSPAAPDATGSHYHVPSPFNRAILAQPLSPQHPLVLASPVAGTGVGISMLHAVLLRALTEAAPDDRAAWIRAVVDANPLRIWDHGRTLTAKEDLARVVGDQFEQFCALHLPKLVELGVVERR